MDGGRRPRCGRGIGDLQAVSRGGDLAHAIRRHRFLAGFPVGVAHGEVSIGDSLLYTCLAWILWNTGSLREANMSLYCTICRYPVPEGVNQCINCRNGFIPQLACSNCNRTLARGSNSCFQCRHERPGAVGPDLEPTTPDSGMQSLAPRPPSFIVQNLVSAPPVLPGLPAHVNAMPMLPECYRVSRNGVVADIRTPAGDIENMQAMGQTVVILHTLAAKMSEFSIGIRTSGEVVEIVQLLGQTVVILHTLAGRMNGFMGHMELTRQNIRGGRLLATGLQEEVEMFTAESRGCSVAGHSSLTRQNIRGCRELAIDLQEEIELRRGPQG